jgi:hypothetical protein
VSCDKESHNEEPDCGCTVDIPLAKEDDNCKWYYPETSDMFIQIPDSILSCVSTERLTYLVLKYPFFRDAFARNFLDHGLDRMFTNFNGVRKLFSREDFEHYLLERYRERICCLSLLEDENMSGIEKVHFIWSVNYIDALLSRVEGSRETLIEILQNLVIGYETISNVYEEPPQEGYRMRKESLYEHNYFARGHIIIKLDEQYRKHIRFTSFGPDNESRVFINQLSYELIK